MHPIFLLTNASLYEEYRALVREIGFGAVVAFDEGDALGDNYNDNYLPEALEDGLEVRSCKPVCIEPTRIICRTEETANY